MYFVLEEYEKNWSFEKKMDSEHFFTMITVENMWQICENNLFGDDFF